MKTTKQLSKLCMLLLVALTMIGMLMFPAAADTSPVTSVTVDKDKILNATTPYLLDTGAGYITDDGTQLASYPLVAQFDSATGTLTLQNYDGGAISTSATGDLTIKLTGNNSIRHKYTGINLYGGNLTITAENAATLDIQNIPAESFSDEATHIFGIQNNFANGFPSAEKSGDSVTITGKASITISTTKEKGSGTANGIGAYGDVSVLESASLEINSANKYTCPTTGICSYAGSITVNTAGDLAISAYGKTGYESGENLFQATTDVMLKKVGSMTLDWTYSAFYDEAKIAVDVEKFAIGTLPDDTTSATYAYKFPITVTNGTAKIGDQAVESAPKGATVTLVADTPEAGQGFYQWGCPTENVVFANHGEATTTFDMPAAAVEIEANYAPAHDVTVNNGTASIESAVSGKTVTVTADEAAKGYQFVGWTVQAGAVSLSDPTSSTTTFVMGDADVELTATYQAIEYMITVTNGGASIDGTPTSTATIKDTVTITANDPATGYKFKEWQISTGSCTIADATAATTTFGGLSSDVTIVAVYEKATFAVTTERALATKDGNPVTSAQIGDVFTITAEERAGATFNGWSVNGGTVASADSTTTFTADGTGNVTITALYDYIDYTVSIKDGKGYVNHNDNEITDANVDEEIYISADSPASGYAFIRWEVVSGEITLEDPTSSDTTFTMIAGNVVLEAIYAEIVLLDRLDFTLPTPTVGAHPSFVLTPAEPTKYSVDTVRIYLYEDPYPDLTDADVYLLGKGYELALRFELQNGYELADDAKFYINGMEMSDNGTYTKRYYFEFPVPITVTGGKAYADGDRTEQITQGRNQWVYLRADEAPEGKVFKYWKVVSGNVTISQSTNEETDFRIEEAGVEIVAIFATPLEEMHFTLADFVRGENVNLTVNSAEPEKYWAENVVIEIYSVCTPLTPSDKYLPLTEYKISFDVVTADGSIITSETVKTLNGETLYGNYYESAHWGYLTTRGAVTVTGGKAYADSDRTVEITEAESNDYVYVTAADPAPGKIFVKWLVKKGDISIDTTSRNPSFRIYDEEIELEAVYATVLTEVTLTVTKPAVGDLATIEITSADPSKYTASLIEFYLYYGGQTLLPTDPFQHGKTYVMQFEILPADGYAVTEDTVVTVNGDETYAYGGDVTGYEKHRWSFNMPVLVTVTGGKAYTESEHINEIGEVFSNTHIYLKAGEAPEGKEFMMWKITDGTGTHYCHYDIDWYIGSSVSVLTCEAIWAIPIDTAEGTIPPIKVGETPITTVADNSDLYDIVIDGWYYYDEEHNLHEMLPTDTYQPNLEYKCEFSIIPIDGYFIDYGEARITINDKQLSTFGYVSGTGIVHARAYYFDTVCVSFDITGGKLYLNGVETNETEFLPGTVLTLVADESLFPEGQVFKTWATPYVYSTIVGVTDYRFSTLTFTVGVPSAFDSTIVLEAQYQTLTQVNYGPYTRVPHPTIGDTPSYDAGVPTYQNYYGEVLGWYEGETLLEPTHVFEAGKVYTVKLRLTPAAGYRFRDAAYYDTYEPYNSFNGTDVDGIILELNENGEYIVFEVSVQARHHEDSASVTVTAPVAGKAPDKTVTKSPDTYCDVDFRSWEVYDEEAEKYRRMLDGELFEVGKTYRISVDFTTNETHYIDLYVLEVLINGTEPQYRSSGTVAGGYSTCGYYLQFTVEAGEPYDVTVEGGTASVDETPVTEVGGGIVVTITANVPEAGKAFKEWQIVSGENVFFVDATAATTTFVMPAGDVSIKAVYRNTPHTITVEGGTADLDEAGSEETVTITADNAPDGKYFAGWECVSGGVTFSDATQKTTTFVMTGEAVEVRVIWADKIYLEELTLTVTKPANGELPSEEITSADPTKYTATLDYWWDNFNNREMGAEDTFSYGVTYGIVFDLELDEKYYINNSTVVTVNGKKSGYYSSNPPYLHRYADLYAPVPITVEGGVATNAEDEEITEQKYGSIVYLTVGEIPEGKSFLRWEVVSGGISISNVNQANGVYFYMYTKEPVTVRAIYHTHTYGDDYQSNATHHWKECNDPDCTDKTGSKTSETKHTPGPAATETEPQTCTVCGYELAPKLKSYTVTVTGGKIYVDDEEVASGSKVAPNTEVKIVADVPDEGKYFSGWSGNSSLLADNKATETTFTMGTSNVSFTANYNSYAAVPYSYFYLDFLVPYTGGKPVDGDQEDTYNKSVSTVIGYYDGETKLTSADTFVQGKSYTVELRIVPQMGYCFDTAKTYRIEQYYDGTRAEIVSLSANEILCRFTFVALTPITDVNVSFTLPVSGEQASFVATLPEDAPYTVNAVEWYDGDTWYTFEDTLIFENGKTYSAWMELIPKEGYTFSPYVEINMILPAGFVADSDWLDAYGDDGYVGADYVCAPNPSKATVSVTDGGAYVYEADDPSAEEPIGTRLYLFANEPADGKVFLKWEIVSGNAVIDDPYAAETSFLLAENVVIKATYADNVERTITVTGGTADKAVAKAGETVTLTANAAPEGKYFYKWDVKSGGATLANSYETTTTFTMTGEAVEIEAVFLDPVTEIVLKTNTNKPTAGATAAPFTIYSVNGSTELVYLIDIWAGWYIMPTAAVDWDNEKSVGYYPTFGEAYYVVYFEIWNDEEAELFDENCKLILQFNDGDIEAVFEDIGTKFTWIDFIATFNLTHTHSYGEKINAVTEKHTQTELSPSVAAHYYCSVCDKYFDENKTETTLDALTGETPSHSYGNWITSDADNHWKVCACGKKDQEGAHVYTDASDMTCNTCGHDRTAPHTHGNGQKVDGQSASCTADGWKDYYQCSCGKIYTEAACQNEITDLVAWKAGDGKLAGGHNYGEKINAVTEKHTQTELSPSVAAHYHCSVCDKYFDENKTETTLDALTGETPSHSYGNWITSDADNHWKVCACGKKDQEGAHVYTDASDMTCNTCGHDRTAPHTHGNGQKVDGQSASCTADGWKDYYQCSCGKIYTDANCTTEITDLVAWKTGDGKIAASHNYGNLIAKKDANCTETGMQAHYECSVCHTLFDENQNVKTEAELTIATNDSHSFGAWASNGNGTHTRTCSRNAAHKQTENCAGGTATCTQKANCSTCGGAHGAFGEHQYGTLIPAVAEKHTQTELAAGIAAHYKCSVCQKYFTENKVETTLDALTGETPTHSYGDWITSDTDNHWKVCECGQKDAEGAHGYTDASDMTCNTCGHDRTAPHTHGNGQKVNGQAASCIENGWKDYYQCSCGKIYTDQACTNEITDLVAWKAGEGKIAASHNYGTLIAKKDANCIETGMQAHYECSVCHTHFDENQNVKTEAELTIETNDSHSFGAWTSNGDGTHTRVCSRNAAHKQTENCAGGTATCTQKAICSTCITAYGSLAAHQHSAEWSKNADKHWYECTCGDKKDQADHIPGAAATETQPQICTVCGYVIAPATGHVTHVPDNEWASNETHHWHTCTGCDEQLDKAAHTDGDKNGKCDACDYTMSSSSDEPVDPNGQKEGLSGGAIAVIAVGSVAVAGIGGFSIFWFVIKKKSFTDLGALLKVGCKKASAIAKRIGERISSVFKKK